MPKLARVVVAGRPYHVLQRGNRRQKVFFSDEDKVAYLKILGLQSKLFGVKIWAYCLMSNHVHLIAVPEQEESLAKAIGETHALYTRMVNFREGWRGYLWQGRFKSVILDDQYLFAAIRYVQLNPVRARIVNKAEAYEWSSARAHILNLKDEVLSHCYLQDDISDWRQYLDKGENEQDSALIRKHSESGRPIGSDKFLSELESLTGRLLIKQKPGPKMK